MRRTIVPMCTMLIKETQTRMVWETCVTTVLLNIILIRSVDYILAHFLPPNPPAIMHIYLPALFYSSAVSVFQLRQSLCDSPLKALTDLPHCVMLEANPSFSSRTHQFNKAQQESVSYSQLPIDGSYLM